MVWALITLRASTVIMAMVAILQDIIKDTIILRLRLMTLIMDMATDLVTIMDTNSVMVMVTNLILGMVTDMIMGMNTIDIKDLDMDLSTKII